MAQHVLRAWIKYWSGFMRGGGYSDSQIYISFYLKFNIDVWSAMALNTDNAEKLTNTIKGQFYEIH